jgi:hypothetical protein
MRNVDATIASAFENSKESSTSSSWAESNIEEGLEWSLVILDILINVVVFTVDFVVSLVDIAKTDLSKKSSGKEKSSAISRGVVCKSSSESEVLQLS